VPPASFFHEVISMSRNKNTALQLHPIALATLWLLGGIAGPAFAGQANLGGLSSSSSHDRFIVKYRTGSAESRDPAARERSLNRASSAVQVRGGGAGSSRRPVGLRHQRRLAVGAELVRTSEKLDRASAETLMRRLAADPNVEYVEVDRLMQPAEVPDDPNFPAQWHYQAPVVGNYGINLPAAWEHATGNGIVVAVLDTGSTQHSDMVGRTVAGYDFLPDVWMANDGDGRDNNPSDPGNGVAANACGGEHRASNSSWHGTHVAGTIAAATNNRIGVAGVARGARVQHVRVLGRCGGWGSDIADGIVWAAGGVVAGVPANDNPAKVLNLSLSGRGACSRTVQDAINSATGRGATVVVAAGNDGRSASDFEPSNCENVVVVGATDQNAARAQRTMAVDLWEWSSNFGAAVDLSAPGKSITSTMNLGAQDPAAEGYAARDGTSMATPHVAGVVALMQSVRPANDRLTPAQVERILKDTATRFPRPTDQPLGDGIVNAEAAVRAAMPVINTVALTKGVPVNGLTATAGNSLYFTLVVPEDATDLTFNTYGSNGDAELEVKHDSAPTSTSYDCRSVEPTSNESCTISAPQAGTYHVRVWGWGEAVFSGLSLVGDYTINSVRTYTADENFTISDNKTVESPFTVSGRSGNAPASTSVSVAIVHTYIGDLKVSLISPDGSEYVLHNRTGRSADNINQTYTLTSLSGESLNGTWKLRVNDNADQDVGKIDSWSITF
jgi:serine protease